jgi:hypothetical protein
MLAFAILALLTSSGFFSEWAKEPCAWCGGGPGPSNGSIATRPVEEQSGAKVSGKRTGAANYLRLRGRSTHAV